MKKLKTLISILVITALSAPICFAEPTKSDAIKEEMKNITIITAQTPHANIVTTMKKINALYNTKENAPHARVIAECFKNFVYSLYPRHITAVEKGCLKNFYFDTLIRCFEMKTEDVIEIEETINDLPNVVEHRILWI